MQTFLIIFFTVFILNVNGQSFISYRDTINHFSIDIPVGWKYGVNKDYPTIILLAYRTPTGPKDTARSNFNINVIETPTKTLDKSFADLLKYFSDAENYKLIDTGDITINGLKFRWLVETHKNDKSDIQMHNYDFVTLKNGKTYILTLVTFSYAFDTDKPLFNKIASSFKLLN